ncbi:hypothetical protein CCP3SC5AM1_720004 [Gammaproteobacteria bacterium]
MRIQLSGPFKKQKTVFHYSLEHLQWLDYQSKKLDVSRSYLLHNILDSYINNTKGVSNYESNLKVH